jgi:hypothetical protein
MTVASNGHAPKTAPHQEPKRERGVEIQMVYHGAVVSFTFEAAIAPTVHEIEQSIDTLLRRAGWSGVKPACNTRVLPTGREWFSMSSRSTTATARPAARCIALPSPRAATAGTARRVRPAIRRRTPRAIARCASRINRHIGALPVGCIAFGDGTGTTRQGFAGSTPAAGSHKPFLPAR